MQCVNARCSHKRVIRHVKEHIPVRIEHNHRGVQCCEKSRFQQLLPPALQRSAPSDDHPVQPLTEISNIAHRFEQDMFEGS